MDTLVESTVLLFRTITIDDCGALLETSSSFSFITEMLSTKLSRSVLNLLMLQVKKTKSSSCRLPLSDVALI